MGWISAYRRYGGRNRDILGQRLGNPGAEPLAREVPRGDLARGTVAQCVEDECPALDAKGVLAELALGHGRCNLQGVGDGLDSCQISHTLRLLVSIAVIAIWLLMAPDAVPREVQLQAYAKGWSLS